MLTVCHPEEQEGDFAVQVEVVVAHNADALWSEYLESREGVWITSRLAGEYTIAVRYIH